MEDFPFIRPSSDGNSLVSAAFSHRDRLLLGGGGLSVVDHAGFRNAWSLAAPSGCPSTRDPSGFPVGTELNGNTRTMKENPLWLKWFRRLVQLLLAAASLLVLTVLLVNWWGARLKRDVIADMKRAGRPLSLAEIVPPLPPDEENFAMIPILAQAREEWTNGPDPFGQQPPPGGASRKLAAMLPAKIPVTIRLDEPKGMKLWKDKLGLTGTDAECLEKYELQHQEVLGQLRAGLSRPYTLSPQFHRFAGKSELYGNCFHFPKMLVFGFSKAIRFRAELAMAADRPELACESYLILLRLAEMLRSESLQGQSYQWTVFAQTMPALARALQSGKWSHEHIHALRSMLAGVKVLDETRESLDLENIHWFAIVDKMRRHNDGKGLLYVTDNLTNKPMPQWANTLISDVENAVSRRLPQGWFDANGAIVARAGLELRNDLGEGDDLSHWVEGYKKHAALARLRTNWGGWMQPSWSLMAFLTAGAETGARYQILVRQAVVACDLEIHRQTHGGHYPQELAELSPPATDPLTGENFRYRLEGDGNSYVLYSVGFDLKDDEGKEFDRGKWKAEDFLW